MRKTTRLLLFSAVCLLFLTSLVTAQEPNGQNLIVNPSAESPLSNGWTILSGDWQPGREVAAKDGNYHFFAGVSQEAVILQEIDVSALADAIDANQQQFEFQAYIQSHTGFAASDSARAVVIYLEDASNDNALAMFDSGEQIVNGRWQLVEDTRTAPAGTRVIIIGLVSTRYGGYDNDGYFDDLSLVAVGSDIVSSAADTTTSPAIKPTLNADPNLDSDGDGITNDVDRCFGAIPGATAEDGGGCPTEFDPYADLVFDDSLHEAWYGRFWTGSCAEVPVLFCVSGPGWHDTVETLLSRFSEIEHGYARNRLWALGRAVGFDWARDNNIDEISTDDVQIWGGMLESAAVDTEIYAALESIENEVCIRLGSGYILGGFATGSSCASPIPAAYPSADQASQTTVSTNDDIDGDDVADTLDSCSGRIAGASAEDRSGCPTELDIDADLVFDDLAHEAWYRNFWTGSCDGVPSLFCVSTPGWFNTTQTLVAYFSDEEQGYIRNRVWALGRTVGYEWARDNGIRLIDTDDLREWNEMLERATSAETVSEVIEIVEEAVCIRLGANSIPGGYATGMSCE